MPVYTGPAIPGANGFLSPTRLPIAIIVMAEGSDGGSHGGSDESGVGTRDVPPGRCSGPSSGRPADSLPRSDSGIRSVAAIMLAGWTRMPAGSLIAAKHWSPFVMQMPLGEG